MISEDKKRYVFSLDLETYQKFLKLYEWDKKDNKRGRLYLSDTLQKIIADTYEKELKKA